MPAGKFFAYYPERILWGGMILLGTLTIGFALLSGFALPERNERIVELKRVKETVKEEPALDFCLAQPNEEVWSCPIPEVQSQLSFSFDPPRPEEKDLSLRLSVRMKQGGASKRFNVPCRVDLAYVSGLLSFDPSPSSFWMQVDGEMDHLVGTVFVDGRSGEPFVVSVEPSPILSSREFEEGSPFRILADGRWWGADLCRQAQGYAKVVHRIDVGSLLEAKLLDVEEAQWIVFEDNDWRSIVDASQAEGKPLARVHQAAASGLQLEGWEGDRHVRLLLSQPAFSPFKAKTEELFGSIRIRSDKQISCVLDKQCLILRINDWVVKVEDRWKILRKPDEKEAFLKGKIVGELFVLDQILNKHGQKSIVGHIYNSARTQKVIVDLPVSGRKPASGRSQTAVDQKGKAR